MIVRLEFDIFYTTIKAPYISEIELRKGLDKPLERWLNRNGYTYDDDAVIKWLKETKFQDDKIEVLEKHKCINDNSSYTFDVVLYF